MAQSELVYLFGTQFAPKGSAASPGAHLPDNKEVDIARLGQTLLAVAVLANEQAGSLRLEARDKKTWFGLRTVRSLYAVGSGRPASFPAESWESRIGQQLIRAKDGTSEVESLVFSALAESESPWGEVVGILLGALARRGLLETVDTRVLKIFHSKRFRLPDSTATAAQAQPLEPIREMLATAQRERPEIWKLLAAQIKRGVERRQKTDDTDYSGD